eukprot:scaffold14251_cov180-Amphora_coffeaeformis.AAC.1
MEKRLGATFSLLFFWDREKVTVISKPTGDKVSGASVLRIDEDSATSPAIPCKGNWSLIR